MTHTWQYFFMLEPRTRFRQQTRIITRSTPPNTAYLHARIIEFHLLGPSRKILAAY